MRHTDHQHDGDIGLHEACEVSDAPRCRRSELAHEEAGALGDPEHGDGSADLVVERLHGGDGLALGFEDAREEVLGGGLAVRSGDADDAKVSAGTDARDDLLREGAESCDRIRYDDLADGDVDGVLDDRQHGACLGGGTDEAVAVGLGSGLGHEDRPGAHRA